MPEFQQVETVQGYSQDQILFIAYGTFQRLGYEMATADGNTVAAYARKGKSRKQLIEVETAASTIVIKSRMIRGEIADLFGKNRKNTEDFLNSFSETMNEVDEDKLKEWEAAMIMLQQKTIIANSEENKEAAEYSGLNISKGPQVITYLLIGVNLLVFILMVVNGVQLFEPTVDDLIKWGGNYKPLTTGGEWWRLLTSFFIHIGLIHLLLNMYALIMVGKYLEGLIGKFRFLAAYFGTGIFASLISIWWNDNNIISAGASGAVFGLYGVLLALLTTRLIPLSVRAPLLSSIGIFIVYNLLYGAGSNVIDNAAHIGGLVSGLVTGYSFLPGLKSKNPFSAIVTGSLVIIISISISSIFLFNKKDDSLKYGEKMSLIIKLQDDAVSALEYGAPDDLMKLASTVAQPKWQEAKNIIEETRPYYLDENLKKHRELMIRYIDLRIEHVNLVIIALRGDQEVNEELKALVLRINAIVDQLAVFN